MGVFSRNQTEDGFMETTIQVASVSKAALWTGRIIEILIVLFMLFDSVTKIIKVHQVVESMARIGFPENRIVTIGVALLVSLILYVIPRTSILGAILLTGYLGGAVCANVLARTALFNLSFPIIFGVLVWLALYLRETRLRSMIPLRS
jgi:hypothetical protein